MTQLAAAYLIGYTTNHGGLFLISTAVSYDSEASPNKFLSGGSKPVAGEYIVVLNEPAPTAANTREQLLADVEALVLAKGGLVIRPFRHALFGLHTRMSEKAARAVSGDSRVGYVAENGLIDAHSHGSVAASWGLDRIDQHPLQPWADWHWRQRVCDR